MRMVKFALFVLLLVNLSPSFSYAATADRITGAIDSSKTIELQKSLHPKAQAQYDQGPADPAFKLTSLILMTAPSVTQQKALDRLLAQQQDPSSRNYHKWLTPAEYAERFGLSQNDLNRITTWLKSQGFVIQSIGGGRNTVTFSGTAAQVQSAFKADIHRYNVDGEEHFANATPLMVPAALGGIVSGILGTHDFLMRPASRTWSSSGPRARPDYYDGMFVFPNFLAPADIATIYDIPSTMDGTGQTLAVMGQTDIFLADINDFRSAFGLTQISGCTANATGVVTACNDPHFQYVLVGSDPGVPDSLAQGDVTEADLDVEWSGAVAPNAQIIYVNSPAGNVLASLNYALNPPTGTPIPAPVVSLSYGLCEHGATNLETLLQQGASEGITVVNSTGDSGAAACDPVPSGPNLPNPPYTAALKGLTVSYPASSPWVTAVGGTAISLANDSYPNPNPTYWNTSNGATFGSAVKYIPELSWNDDETWAAYCAAPVSGDTFCSQGGTPAVTGWVAITSAQTAQEDVWIGSGGGGASNCLYETGTTCTGGLVQPAWQKGLKVPNLPTGAAGFRWIPDVSFLASPNFPGYILCTPQNPDAAPPTYTSTCVNGISGANGAVEGFQSIIGGTSASAPVFAGIVALLNQYLAGPSSPGLGSINSTLYGLAANKATNHAFNQTTSGDNMVYCVPTEPKGQPANIVCPAAGVFGYSASNFDPATGYNLATGLGSVDVNNLAVAWAGGRTSTSTSLSPSTNSTYQGASVTLTASVTPASATGNVAFMNGSTTLGTAAVGSGGTAVFTTTALPVGTNSNITATYNGSGTLMPSTSPAATVTIAAAFTLVPSASSYQVTQGQSVNATVALTLATGFGGTVSFTCQNPGSGITCTAPPATNVSGNVSFQVATMAPSAALQRPFDRGTRLFYAALLPGLLGIVFTFGSRKRSLRGTRMLALIMVLGFSTLWLGSCGSSNNSNKNPGTPKGTYTINVSGTSGSINIPASFKIVVQ